MMDEKDLKEYEDNIRLVQGLKKSNKYKYMSGQMYEHHGSRTYDFGGQRLPSVTTILGLTKDQSFIKDWKEKVGHEKAEEIKNHSSKRGTSMHKFLESHITGVGYDDLSPIGTEAKPMAEKIIEVGLTPVDEWYGSEITLHYPGLYAGSTDLVCLHMAHDYVYGSKIEQGVIMVCTPDLYYQEFKTEGIDLRTWKHKFLKRLDMYHEIQFDEKEKTTPMKAEDFKI